MRTKGYVLLKKNIIIYLFWLAFIIFLWNFFRSYYIGMLLVLIPVLPVVSIWVLKKTCEKCILKVYVPEEPEEEGSEINIEICIENKLCTVALDTEIDIHIENIFYGEKSDIRLSMPIIAGNGKSRCGISKLSLPFVAEGIGGYTVTVETFFVKDILGLVKRNAKIPDKKSFVIIPVAEIKDSDVIYSYNDKAAESEECTKKGNDFSEISGIREYVPGDLMRDIHWKLSSKRDILMIKERISMSSTELVIVPEFSNDKKNTELIVKELYSVVYGLIKYRIFVRILMWSNVSFEFQSVVIDSEAELVNYFKEVFCTNYKDRVPENIRTYMRNCFPHMASYVLMNVDSGEVQEIIV